MGKSLQAAKLSVFVGLLLGLGLAGSLAAPASAAPAARPGEYYGSENGNVVEFTLVKSKGVIKGHYLARALNFTASDQSPCLNVAAEAGFFTGNAAQFQFVVRNGRITNVRLPPPLGFSGSFTGRSKASGRIVLPLAGDVRCVFGWTAERVSHPTFPATGTWIGTGDGLGVTFKVSAGGRIASDFNFTIARPIGKPPNDCVGPFGLGYSTFIPPDGSSFSRAAEAEGAGSGFVASFQSATSASGTFQGTGECQSPAMAWQAQPSG